MFAAAAEASKIIYTCGYELCSVRPDGTGKKRLTSDGSKPYEGFTNYGYEAISASRDGRRLVYHRAGEAWLADGAVRNRKRLKFARGYVQLHPDGNRIYWLVYPPGFQGYPAYELCRGTLRPLKYKCQELRTNNRAYTAWGPGGTVLSTHADERGEVCVTDWRKAPPRCTDYLARARENETFFLPPELSPDERLLAATVEIFAGPDGNRIALYDARRARRIRFLTTGAESDVRPHFSPDGREVLLTRPQGSSDTPSHHYDLIRVGVRGGKERLVVDHAHRVEPDAVWVR